MPPEKGVVGMMGIHRFEDGVDHARKQHVSSESNASARKTLDFESSADAEDNFGS